MFYFGLAMTYMQRGVSLKNKGTVNARMASSVCRKGVVLCDLFYDAVGV
jgi:hypothetical protein